MALFRGMSPLRWFHGKLWIAALLLALGFLAADSFVRFRRAQAATDFRPTEAPVPAKDPRSPTGYAFGQRDRVLPNIGTDSYHWIMQTQRMLAGNAARIRSVDYDNNPDGREVHWSSGLRWWMAALAWVDGKIASRPIAISVERVAFCAHTLLLVLVLLLVVPLTAWRFGSLPAGLLALGLVTVYPAYELFVFGFPDHHGIVVVFGMLTVLFLVAGGGGWVRAADTGRLGAEEAALHRWLPERKEARRWFAASAMAGGAGLWVSAATQIPILIGIGLGALYSLGWLGRKKAGQAPWISDLELWRVWGLAGFLSSLGFYFLEYFPSHLGWRLEVNHPLYALAWLGAGDLLCRTIRWMQGTRPVQTSRDLVWLALSLVFAAAPLAVIVLARKRTFWVSDPFLWALHKDYIIEFNNLFDHLKSITFFGFLSDFNVLPLLGIPMVLMLGHRHLFNPWKALLATALFPSAVMLLLAFQQIRWLGISCTIWSVCLVSAAFVMTGQNPVFRWTAVKKIAAAIFLALIFLPYPCRVAGGFASKINLSRDDFVQVYARDVAHYLRGRLGGRPGVALSSPVFTTHLIYFGGFKGLGTLYWENLEGLKSASEIFGAPSEDKALELIRKYGVTHIVVFSWDPFAAPYSRLARGLRSGQPPPEDAFMLRLVLTASIPQWLRPIHYSMPVYPSVGKQSVQIFEVVPEQTREEALVHIAQFLFFEGDTEDAEAMLRLALESKPDDLSALANLGFVQQKLGQEEQFAATVRRIRDVLQNAGPLSFGEEADLATIFALANDGEQIRLHLGKSLEIAQEKDVRSLTNVELLNFLRLVHALGLSETRPDILQLARSLLSPPQLEKLEVRPPS